ncbi:MAG TPA: redoxin domain-containing protein, partial [Planctomycetaceae bacterium]|nr:redoxin domain-containing protein [Planctomycetaceae bacterium]
MQLADRFPSRPSRTLLLGVCFSVVAAVVSARSKFNEKLSFGDPAPEWSDLPATDGRPHSLSDYKEARALVIVFTGSHCPMTKLYEERLLAAAAQFAEQKVQFVAINVDRKKPDTQGETAPKPGSSATKFPFPYLFDASQKSAAAYGATVTPQFFVLDAERKIAYMGAFDDNARAEKVEKHYLTDAV